MARWRSRSVGSVVKVTMTGRGISGRALPRPRRHAAEGVRAGDRPRHLIREQQAALVTGVLLRTTSMPWSRSRRPMSCGRASPQTVESPRTGPTRGAAAVRPVRHDWEPADHPPAAVDVTVAPEPDWLRGGRGHDRCRRIPEVVLVARGDDKVGPPSNKRSEFGTAAQPTGSNHPCHRRGRRTPHDPAWRARGERRSAHGARRERIC